MRTIVLLLAAAVLSTSCARNLKTVRRTYAAELSCPVDNVIVLQMPDGHPQQGESWQVYGCDQRRICFDDNKRGVWACRWADELEQAAARLKLETNCPTEQMKPLAYTETPKGPTEDDDGSAWAWQGGAYRIDVCGQHYVCNMQSGSPASCAPAPNLAGGQPAPPGQLPPPPPPSR